jgi:flagellar hook-basal body protein
MYESLNYTAGKTTQTTINPTGIDVGLGVRVSGVQKNFTEGDLKLTSNTLDLAIQGKGFFQITLPSGETAYTRNGAFKLNVAIDQNNPLGASVSLVNAGTGLVIGGAVSLIFEIAGLPQSIKTISLQLSLIYLMILSVKISQPKL